MGWVTAMVTPASGLSILFFSLPCYRFSSAHIGKIGIGAVPALLVRSFTSRISSAQPPLHWETRLQSCSVSSFTKMIPTKKTQPFLKAKQAKKNLCLLLLRWIFLYFPKDLVDRAAAIFHSHSSGSSKLWCRGWRNWTLLSDFAAKKTALQTYTLTLQPRHATYKCMVTTKQPPCLNFPLSLIPSRLVPPRHLWRVKLKPWPGLCYLHCTHPEGCMRGMKPGRNCVCTFGWEGQAQGLLFIPPCLRSHRLVPAITGCNVQPQRPVSKGVGNHSASLKHGTGKAKLESLSGNACRVKIFESSTAKPEWLLNHNKSYLAFL